MRKMDEVYQQLRKRVEEISDERRRLEALKLIDALQRVEEMQDIGTYIGLVIQLEELLPYNRST